MAHQTQNIHENGEKTNSKLGNRFLGVRKRPSGRWVAEIKDSSQKLRLWLGTFDGAEEAAFAYDSAARLLRGRNAKTNFSYRGIVTTHEENCKLLGKNPKLYQLLQHAMMKNFSKFSSLNCMDFSKPSINSGTLVEETIVCSQNEDDNQLCSLSLGSAKVYSSVIVAPSFSGKKLSFVKRVPEVDSGSFFPHANGSFEVWFCSARKVLLVSSLHILLGEYSLFHLIFLEFLQQIHIWATIAIIEHENHRTAMMMNLVPIRNSWV